MQPKRQITYIQALRHKPTHSHHSTSVIHNFSVPFKRHGAFAVPTTFEKNLRKIS